MIDVEQLDLGQKGRGVHCMEANDLRSEIQDMCMNTDTSCDWETVREQGSLAT